MLIMVRYMGAGEHYEALHLTPDSRERFETDWRSFLSTGKPLGGFYSCNEAGNEYTLSLHFEGIAAIHFGEGSPQLGSHDEYSEAVLKEGPFARLHRQRETASWFG
ncbi:MAG TPA: hypothetical protein VKU00_13150 [Chthonomonadaceae bacterium]|nr:hypothetical protein [Chthonomonadaceae bacterium]